MKFKNDVLEKQLKELVEELDKEEQKRKKKSKKKNKKEQEKKEGSISLEKYTSKSVEGEETKELKPEKKRSNKKKVKEHVKLNKEGEKEFMDNFMDMLETGRNDQIERIRILENKINMIIYILVSQFILGLIAISITSVLGLAFIITLQIVLTGALIMLLFK